MTGGLPALTDPIDQLDAIELVRVRLPMRRPLRAAHGTGPPQREVVLVRALGADGHEGWGECSALEAPTYTAEHTDGAWAVLRQRLAPAALSGGLQVVGEHPMASAALEGAVIDLILRREGRSLLSALGGRHPDPVRWTVVAGGADSTGDLVAGIEAAFDRARDDRLPPWFPIGGVKLKIAPGWDLEPVRAVRARWPDLNVSVDANASFGAADVPRLVALADLLSPGAYLEQPLGVDDLAGSARLAGLLDGRGVALDEGVGSAGDVRAASGSGAASTINLKPARVGGLRAAVEVARAAREATPPMHVFVGGMVETGVGRATALALAASRAVGAQEIDLGPSAHYFEPGTDVVDIPVGIGGDLVELAARPGIGVTPVDQGLRPVATDRLLIRP